MGNIYRVKVPNGEGDSSHIADGKGVHREVESEGSPKQTSGLRNTNLIRLTDDWISLQLKVKSVSPQRSSEVDEADIWRERYYPYPGRSTAGQRGMENPKRARS